MYSKYLKLNYHNYICELDDNYYIKMVYTCLSLNFIYDYVRGKEDFLNPIHDVRNDVIDRKTKNQEYRDNRNFLIPFISCIDKDNYSYKFLGFYDDNGFYRTYISGKTAFIHEDISDLFNTCLKNQYSICNCNDVNGLIKIIPSDKDDDNINGHTEKRFIDDLDTYINCIYNNNLNSIIIVDICSLHDICDQCKSYLRKYMKQHKNVVFRVLSGDKRTDIDKKVERELERNDTIYKDFDITDIPILNLHIKE